MEKITYRLLLAMLIGFLCSQVSYAAMVTIGKITYEVSPYIGKAIISNVETDIIDEECVIHSSIQYEGNNYPVAEIKKEAFMDCSLLTSISIPSSVTTIGKRVFKNCTSLKEISIPNAKSIEGSSGMENELFKDCKNLEKVDFGYSSEIIGGDAFSGCESLQEIIILNPEALEKDKLYFFINKRRYYTEKNIRYDEYTLMSLKRLVLPVIDDITKLADKINTSWSAYRTVIIKNGKAVGKDYYSPATLEEVKYVGDLNERYTLRGELFSWCDNIIFENVRFNAIDTYKINYQGDFWFDGEALPKGLFASTAKLRSITLSFPGAGTRDSFSNLGELFAEDDKKGQATVQLFEDGSKKTYYVPPTLEEVTVLDGCVSIPYGAFSGFTMLKKVTLPASVYMVGEKAFYGCAQMTDTYCQGADPAVAFSNTFDAMRLTSCKLHVPYNSSELYKSAEGWKRFNFIQEEAPVVINVNKNIINAGVIYGLDEYRAGYKAQLTAIANSGYKFDGWYENESLITSDDTYEFTATKSRNLTAMFSAVYKSNPVEVDVIDGVDGIKVHWPKEDNAAHYYITLYKDPEMTDVFQKCHVLYKGEPSDKSVIDKISYSDSQTMEITFFGLPRDTEYYYSITGYNLEGQMVLKYDGSFKTWSSDITDILDGIGNVTVTGFYNVQGIRSDKPWSGVNIVKLSDGSVIKIMNK